jgi:hypothetical protein
MRLEADHRRRQGELAAAILQQFQERLVAEMHAVEIADRGDTAAARLPAGFQAASNQHGAPGREIAAQL